MIKLGWIGIAHDHSDGFMQCIRNYPNIFEVVGIAEENPENIKLYGSKNCYKNIPFFAIDELLNRTDIDAFMVESEEEKLVYYAKKCVEKGFSVHIDKPAGDNLNDFKDLLKLAKKRNLIVQVGYMYRYNPAVEYCVNAVKNGELGEVFRVNAVMNTYHTPDKRKWLKKFKGGNMFYLGCHMIDLITLILGQPKKVTPLNKSTGFDNVTVKDIGFAVLEYDKAISTVEASSVDINGYGRRSLLVSGSKGTIEIRPIEGNNNTQPQLVLTLMETTQGQHYQDRKEIIDLPKMTGRYDAMMLDFAKMIKGEKENPYTYEYEELVQKVLMAACGDKIIEFEDSL